MATENLKIFNIWPIEINSLVFREELEWRNRKRLTSNGITER
jgi:hypothetical protein